MLDIYDSTGHLTISKQIKGVILITFWKVQKHLHVAVIYDYFDYLESHVRQISGQSLIIC